MFYKLKKNLQIKIEVNRKKKSKTTCEISLMSTLIFV